MEDNLSLSDKVRERYRSMYSGVFYKRYVEGEWTLAEGVIYPMADDAIQELPAGEPHEYRLSIDYGTQNAFAALLWGRYDEGWWAVKEYYHSGRATGIQKTDEEYAVDLDRFVEPYTDGRIKTYVDPSAASFITLLNKRGGYRVIHADNSVADGIRESATAMRKGIIKISPDCINWRKEAQGYVWDEKASEDKPVKVDDHLMDSMRYFVKTTGIAVPKRQGQAYLL
jgi:PBSX family phage terminase large subunit